MIKDTDGLVLPGNSGHGDAQRVSPGVTAPVMRSLDDQFRAEATRVLSRFRRAVEGVVYGVTKTLANSRSLQTALGVDLHVSWQVFKLLGPIEVLATVTYVPAAVSIRKFLALAKKRGIAQDLLDEVNAAFADYEALVASATGDREQFESLVMSFTDSAEAAQVGVQLRKSAFKAHVHYFGTAAETLVVGMLFHPGATPGKVDFLTVRSILGLRRLRASTDMIIERAMVAPGKTRDAGDFFKPGALDPDAAARYASPILPDFCSQPIPPMTTTIDDVGNVRTVLAHRDVGVGQEVDLTTARIYRGTTPDTTPGGQALLHGLIEIARPTRLQVMDTFVHRPTWPRMIASGGIFAHLTSRNPAYLDSAVKLPFNEKVSFLGSGDDVIRISEAPRYADAVRYACRQLDWSLDDMDVYRIRIEYPLMESSVLFRLEEPAVKD
jgi:hypothetical protein